MCVFVAGTAWAWEGLLALWRSWNGAGKRGRGHLVAGRHDATPSVNVTSRLNCDK